MEDKLWLKFENHLLNEGLTKLRIHKLKTMFNVCVREFSKPLDKCTRKDIELFLNKLNRDTITKKNGEKFSGTTKSDIKKFLRQYFKWLKGNNVDFPEEVRWIKTRISKDEKPEEKTVLSIQEVRSLANSFKNPDYSLIILLLFDSGFRIQEMLSVSKRDLTWDVFDENNNKCFWITCNKSKTLTRKVPIPLFTEDIKNFVNSSYFLELPDDKPIFEMSYANLRKRMIQNSKKVLKKEITAHCLRHSSATFYAREYNGNSMLLGNRYGWSYSSKELATYIRRSGTYQKEGAKKVYTNSLMKVQEENVLLRQRMEEVKKELDGIKEQMRINQKPHEELLHFISNPEVQRLFKTLKRLKK